MSKDYSKYEIEDFAFDESFQKWVFDESSDSAGFWKRYTAENTFQTDKILAARALVRELTKDERPDARHDELMRVIWHNIRARTEPKQVSLWNVQPKWRNAAAIVLLVVSVAGWYTFNNIYRKVSSLPSALADAPKGQLAEEVNRSDHSLKIRLADGSTVTLAKDSRLTYPKQFGKKERVVQLTGEAFFEVTRNPDQPFLIYANETVTKVLGTSFRIRAFEDDPKVIVSVSTGKVSVFNQKDLEQNNQLRGVILTANQQAEFSKAVEQFSKTLVEKPRLLTGVENKLFEFSDTQLKDVFDALQAAYGVEIIYDSELVKGRTLRVNLGVESLYEKLTVICNTMNLTYQIVDAKVIIEKNTVNPFVNPQNPKKL
jgi:transmembrane sensor